MFNEIKMAASASQLAVNEAKKVLRRELKKRIAAMTDDKKERESRVITEKVIQHFQSTLKIDTDTTSS